MNKVLLVGPWIGEFGWELFCWQGYVRKLSAEYDKTIVLGRPTNKLLYEDFADEYIPFDPESFKTDAWNCHGSKNYSEIVKSIPHTKYLNGRFDIGMRYTHKGVVDTKGIFFKEQKFIKYEVSGKIEHKFNEEGYDVLFHCRNKTTGNDRNWGYDKWKELYKILNKDILVGCIGNDEAFHIPGTDDLRNINLKELVKIMGKSNLIIGPSSGPLHLASLSGLKHLVWSTEYNRKRYEKDWNPLNTPLIFYSDGGWDPNPYEIKKIIEKEV